MTAAVGDVDLLPQTHQRRAMHTVAAAAGEVHVLPMEPMLATAGPALAALSTSGVPEERVVLSNFLASPQVRERVTREAPAVTTAAKDDLNEHAAMNPGNGDFGDRFSGTLPRRGAS